MLIRPLPLSSSRSRIRRCRSIARRKRASMRAPVRPGHLARSEGAWSYRLPPDGGAAEGFGPRELGRAVVVPVLLAADPGSRLPLDLPGLDGPGGRNDGPAARPLPGRRY